MQSKHDAAGDRASDGVGDDFLVAQLLGGDAVALTELMDRYDRLVRFTVLRQAGQRCHRDPQWLDSVASATWSGFVQSLRRDPDRLPKSIRAYLVQITRNQTISALRRSPVEMASLDVDSDRADTEADGPGDALERLEGLELLRTCLAGLDENDRALVTQLGLITQRRWRDAAAALGISESTLRSRWQRVLGRLRAEMRGKGLEDFLAR